jgi:hypothetical protein
MKERKLELLDELYKFKNSLEDLTEEESLLLDKFIDKTHSDLQNILEFFKSENFVNMQESVEILLKEAENG